MASDLDISRLFEPGAEAALEAYLRLLHPADLAELFRLTDKSEWPQIAARLSSEELADALAEMDEAQQSALGETLHLDHLIRAVDELESDDAADVVASFSEGKAEAVLEGIEDSDAIRELMAYPEDSAGGIMQTELCRVNENLAVSDAIDALRATRDEISDVQRIYLVDEKQRLKGIVKLEDLVLSGPDMPLAAIKFPVEHQVFPDVDQEQVAKIFSRYDLASLPVVNAEGRLLGRITFDDVHDVIIEEASEDILTMAGAPLEDLVYSNRIVRIAMFRLPWLVISLVGTIFVAFLNSRFRTLSVHALMLMSFVPLVMAMTGNVGAQSAMIITRGLAIGKVEWGALGRTFGREVSVAFLLACIAALVVGPIAENWHDALPGAGWVVGGSLLASMALASLAGTAAPILFKRVGIDPALAAGPLVTTMCDILGVSVYLLMVVISGI